MGEDGTELSLGGPIMRFRAGSLGLPTPGAGRSCLCAKSGSLCVRSGTGCFNEVRWEGNLEVRRALSSREARSSGSGEDGVEEGNFSLEKLTKPVCGRFASTSAADSPGPGRGGSSSGEAQAVPARQI